MTERATIESMLKDAYAARVRGDVEGMVRHFADDAVFALAGAREASPVALRCTDCESMRAAMAGLVGAFEFKSHEIVALVVEGDRAVAHTRVTVRAAATGEEAAPRWPTSSPLRTARSLPSSSSATPRSRRRWQPGRRSRERLRRTQEALGSGRPSAPALRCHAPAAGCLGRLADRSCDRLRPCGRRALHGRRGDRACRPRRASSSPSSARPAAGSRRCSTPPPGCSGRSAGKVEIFGAPLLGLNARAGYLFQQDALMPWKTALDNVAVALEPKGVPRSQGARAGAGVARAGSGSRPSSTAIRTCSRAARRSASRWRRC